MTVNLIFTPYNHNGIYPMQLAQNSEVVHINGNETIDGTKTFLKEIRQHTSNLTAFQGVSCKNYSFDFSQTTLNNERGARLISLDKNGDYFGAFQTAANSTNTLLSSIVLVRRKIGGKDISANMGVSIDNSGNISSYAPNCDNVGSIVNLAGILKSGNGYIKLGKACIIQWGQSVAASQNSDVTVTFPVAFNAIPRVIASVAGRAGYNPTFGVHTVTTTSFKAYLSSSENKSGNNSAFWFAIGY